MARTLRGRTVSNDNLAVGSVSGIERTINGAAPPPEKVGGKDNLQTGVAFPTTVVADNMNPGVVTIQVERRTP